MSKFTSTHMDLYNALCTLHDTINKDHTFTSITINKNVKCKPHYDKRNNGLTMIIGLGDYTGGELVILNDSHDDIIDIKCKPHYFNGYLNKHYNNSWTGTRYTLMYYAIRGRMPIIHRPDDIKIVREVYYGNGYHINNEHITFGIEKGDHWIDIGANIGCFAKKCIDNGATVMAYEPDIDNYNVLIKNIDANCADQKAVLCKGAKVQLLKSPYPYSHRVRAMDMGDGIAVSFNDIKKEDCCVKMDIEGSELDILDNCDFTGIRKLVFAYHINCDSSKSNFLRRIDRLHTWFRTIYYGRLPDTEKLNFFPNEIIVYCKI